MGLWFGVWGLGCGVWGLGFRVPLESFAFCVEELVRRGYHKTPQDSNPNLETHDAKQHNE